jgi:hypothetical protein
MARAGFRFEIMARRNIDAQSADGPDATLARFRAAQNRSSGPPGPVGSWLGETLVHAEDIRRPLGITHAYPVDALSRVADFYRGSNLLIGGKNRVAGTHPASHRHRLERRVGSRDYGPRAGTRARDNRACRRARRPHRRGRRDATRPHRTATIVNWWDRAGPDPRSGRAVRSSR